METINKPSNTEAMFALEVMEEYRTNPQHKLTNDTDHAIRICEAILADAIGFKNRASWIEAMQKENFIG